MKKQMERTVYEAPVTERFSVELEGSFCGSIVAQEGAVTITDQEIAGPNDFNENAFSGNQWVTETTTGN